MKFKSLLAVLLSVCVVMGAVSISSVGAVDIGKAAYDSPALLEETEKTPPRGYSLEKESKRTTLVPVGADAVATIPNTEIAWSVSGDTLTLSGKGAVPDYTFEVPTPWLSVKGEITSIVVEEGITALGNRLFAEFTKLKDVKLPESLTKIGETVFFGCTSLKAIVLPKSVTSLGVASFAECTSLESFTAEGLTSVANYAFQSTRISTFEVGSIRELSSMAFWDAFLTAYTLNSENPAYKVEEGVLYSADGKTLVSYPVRKAEENFAIPSTVTSIGDNAFANCKLLYGVTLPNSLESIGSSAFLWCSMLKEVTIPDSVAYAGEFAFYGCGVTTLTFGSGLKSTSYQMFRECYSLMDIDFGTGLEALDAHTFAYCYLLENVSLPANIKSIGNACFGVCRGLKAFSAQGITEIPYQALMNCESLEELNLPSTLESIYREAFYGCEALTKVTLPESVVYVHSHAFPAETEITCLNTALDKYGINGYRRLETLSLTGTRRYDYAYEVLNIVNTEREKEGLKALVMNEELLEAAMTRGAETSVCFAHTRADSSSCFDISSLMFAENIAFGQTTPVEAMDSWMNSPGHRGNILTADFTTIGIGCFEIGGTYYWVQCFGMGADTEDVTKPENLRLTEEVKVSADTFEEEYGSSFITERVYYTYKYITELSQDRLAEGESAEVRLYVENAGYKGLRTPVDAQWQAEPGEGLTISPEGTITALKDGTYKVDAGLRHQEVAVSLVVATERGILGDADMSGAVDVKDATLIQKSVASILTIDPKAAVLADVNGDTEINVKDATAVQKFCADIETGYPVGSVI